MGGWSDATRQGGWHHVRRDETAGAPRGAGRWTGLDVAATIVAFVIHWQVGLAFLALKLWQQASGYQGSVFAFAREKWVGLVGMARAVLDGATLPSGMHLGPRTSGNKAFDAWRHAELARIETERNRLRVAEHEFANYRDELLQAKDREDFDRFMRVRAEPR